MAKSDGVIVCPICGGDNLDGRGVGKPYPLPDDESVLAWDVVRFTCLDCGHKWQSGGNDDRNTR